MSTILFHCVEDDGPSFLNFDVELVSFYDFGVAERRGHETFHCVF